MNEANEAFENINKKVFASLMQLAARIKEELIKEAKAVIDEKDVRATGDLRKAVDGEVTQETDSVIIEIFDSMFYSAYVHQGTKPHFPPLDPIARWVVRKGLSSGAIKRRGSLSKQSHEREIRSIAFLIARKIARKGTEGVKFFELALKQAEPNINSWIKNFGTT